MMNQNQSRYFITATLMDEALLQLLEKKDFAFISVKEICQRAGVNRSTFYLHYQSINDLLEETIELLNKRFVSAFPKDLISAAKGRILTSPDFLRPYLKFVKENKRAYRLIHEKPELFSADKAFKKMYSKIIDPTLEAFNVDEREKEYVFQFYTQGSLAVIKKWVEKECDDDIDFVVDLIARHTHAGQNDGKQTERILSKT